MFEVVRKRLNRLTQQPETVVEQIDAADADIGHDGALVLMDPMGGALLLCASGTWFEAKFVDGNESKGASE